MFHFFFYVIAPGTYYIIPTKVDDTVINNNIKLKQLFLAVVIFLIMSLIVAFVDLRYRLYKSKHKRILSNWTEWGKRCQIRLHE